jgi:sirohydrochlorin cobaltochelatase
VTPAQTHRGIILFAHGSRDPLWRQPMEAVADRARLLDPTAQVQCAYLELMEPDLPTCAAAMAQAGVQSVTVVPMFLGVGKHAREDLPLLVEALKAKYPHIVFRLQPAIGEDQRVLELMANIALDAG